jgi:hypothetical protein
MLRISWEAERLSASQGLQVVNVKGFKFSRRQIWRVRCSGMWHREVWWKFSDVSGGKYSPPTYACMLRACLLFTVSQSQKMTFLLLCPVFISTSVPLYLPLLSALCILSPFGATTHPTAPKLWRHNRPYIAESQSSICWAAAETGCTHLPGFIHLWFIYPEFQSVILYSGELMDDWRIMDWKGLGREAGMF